MDEIDISTSTLMKLVMELKEQCKHREVTETRNVRKIKEILDIELKDSLDAGLRNLGKDFMKCCPQAAKTEGSAGA